MKTKWDVIMKVIEKYRLEQDPHSKNFWGNIHNIWRKQSDEARLPVETGTCAMIEEIKALIGPLETKQDFVKVYLNTNDILEKFKHTFAKEVFYDIGKFLEIESNIEFYKNKFANLKAECSEVNDEQN